VTRKLDLGLTFLQNPQAVAIATALLVPHGDEQPVKKNPWKPGVKVRERRKAFLEETSAASN
jgi:hypothetical protein